MTLAPIQGKCPVCHQDSANTAFQAGAASRDAEIAELNRKVFALKTPCAVALAALEDFNEQAKGRCIFIPAEIDFAIDRLKEVLK